MQDRVCHGLREQPIARIRRRQIMPKNHTRHKGYGGQAAIRPAVGPVRQEDENDHEDWSLTDLPESCVICYLSSGRASGESREVR